jgi:hypothetical protein
VTGEVGWSVADYYRDGYSTGSGENRRTSPARTLTEFAEGPASIRVYGTGTGNQDKERDFIPAYTKFILSSVQEARQERAQIVETFSDFYVFFYGEKPAIFTYSGFLINAKNVNWLADFDYYYDTYMRGTRCVENNARLILTYGGRQVEGYILGVSTQTQAETEMGVPFSFQAIITKKNQIGFSDDFGLSSKGGKTIQDQDIKRLLDTVAGKTGAGTSAPGNSKAYNTTKSVAQNKSPAAYCKPLAAV